MPSERTINPAQAHRKAEKAKALKKSKAQLATQRAEKLARRNPARIERQIEALADEEQSAGSLRPKDKQTLEQLRKDLQAIRKARERLGVSGGDDRDGGGFAAGRKRKWEGDREERRDGFDRRRRKRSELGGRNDGLNGDDDDDDDKGSDSGFSTDESVRRIPMPRDTPPPIPSRARPRRSYANHWGNRASGDEEVEVEREEGATDQRERTIRTDGKEESTTHARTVYEAAPAVRDLRKEAIAKFIPSVVKGKLDLAQGKGRLLEEDEVVTLSRSGYIKGTGNNVGTNEMGESTANMEDEEKRFEAELGGIVESQQAPRTVTIEDAEDEQ